MPPTTVEPKLSLNPQQRDWLKKMAAALQVKLGGPAPQAGGTAADADLAAKCKQIKAAVAPKVKDAIAADPSKKDKIKQLLEAATAQESKGLYAEAFESLKELTTTVKEALQKARRAAPAVHERRDRSRAVDRSPPLRRPRSPLRDQAAGRARREVALTVETCSGAGTNASQIG